jgi:hypothetical protein
VALVTLKTMLSKAYQKGYAVGGAEGGAWIENADPAKYTDIEQAKRNPRRCRTDGDLGSRGQAAITVKIF